jgi:hypothetical protein
MNEVAIPRDQMAKNIDRSIDKAKYLITSSFLSLGILLREVRDNKYYKDLGYSSFTSYLLDKEFSRVSAYKFIAIYEIYRERFGVPEERLQQIGLEKLYLMKDVILDPDKDPNEWLSNAETLKIKDLKYEIKRVKSGLPEEPEELTKIVNWITPKLEALASEVPMDCWSKIYFRDPAPGVVECIIRISINENENDA